MAIDSSAVATAVSKGAAADRSTKNYQRHPIFGANRLPMAVDSERLPELEHGVRNILAVEKRWHLAEDS